jgi:hypothetical protein
MRVNRARLSSGILAAIIVLGCGDGLTTPTATSLEIESGHCAGCILNADDSLFTFVVSTEAEFDSLAANCFLKRIKPGQLPPRPGDEQVLVYVSLKGSGCDGCLDIVNVHETSRGVSVAVMGGFQGECDKLIMPGAWVLIPRTDKQITFQFLEVFCADDP